MPKLTKATHTLSSTQHLDHLLDAIDKAKSTGALPASTADFTPSDDVDVNEHSSTTIDPSDPDAKPYASYVHFSKTGRFEGGVNAKRPEDFTNDAKSQRQMGHYFDYKSWIDARTVEKQAGVDESKKLTKKQIQAFKKRREERKKIKNRWLFEP